MGELQGSRRAQVSSTGASSSGGEGAREERRTWDLGHENEQRRNKNGLDLGDEADSTSWKDKG